MTTVAREKFATRADRDLLAEIRKIAKAEGRQLQSIVEEALEALSSSTARLDVGRMSWPPIDRASSNSGRL